jgi:hypothetical protein
MSFVYSQESQTELAKFLTSERLTAYLIATQGDTRSAIRLYERNTRLSEHLYGVLQACEVALRNSIHLNLSIGFSRTDWYDCIKFGHRELLMVGEAKLAVQKFKSRVTPGQIVAVLTMGFWNRLLSPEYEKALWVPYLHKAFPHYRKPDRVLIFARLEEIRRLRNRVAHHEPIFKKDQMREYAKILEAIRWICPATAAWVDSSSSFPRYVKSLE